MIRPGLDHLALNVPDLDAQVDRLTTGFGFEVVHRFEHFALLRDPATGLRFELGRSEDDQVHLRHLGFCSDDVDGDHEQLVADGMTSARAPHRQDLAGMYTSYLAQPGGVEVQLVRYDE